MPKKIDLSTCLFFSAFFQQRIKSICIQCETAGPDTTNCCPTLKMVVATIYKVSPEGKRSAMSAVIIGIINNICFCIRRGHLGRVFFLFIFLYDFLVFSVVRHNVWDLTARQKSSHDKIS